MKNISAHEGILEILERLPNSVNGNPRYRCYCGGVTFVTRPDCAYSYEITNYRDKPARIYVGTHYGKATLHKIEPCPTSPRIAT